MLFSIIIPTFNALEKLEKTLESTQNQGAELEVWVQDGASTDGTAAWLSQNAARLGFNWTSEVDRGVYDAMNRGAARAAARYLYFLGAGDHLRAGVLERVASALPKHERGLIYGKIWGQASGREYGTAMTNLDLARRNLAHQATFYGRDLWARGAGYDLNYPIFADYVFNMQVFNAPGVEKRFLDFVVADYEENGLSAQRRDTAFERDRGVLVRRHLGNAASLAWQLELRAPRHFLDRLGRVREILRRRGARP